MSVKVNFKKVYKKVSKENSQKAKFATANQMLADMNPFVPLRDATLRSSGHVDADGDSLVWVSPYAKAQFYGTNGIVKFRQYTTPGTGARWDLKAEGLFMSTWVKVFARGLTG
ncbi:minor capsid protein [Listeria monocytogenes]|uniref:minor capsid protein n=1 Tax=Listeria monocytogenes TaxID=1639 RepID=UPI00077B172A|nr:minor capsid protein [Listeria monocytogenes]EAC2379275.1 capsid protein [Listeria monocytogenes]EAD9262732.1 capsid protein [Listeria monocytogenes]EAD9485805.1 capsid protein [Listeria monocytogenes]EAE1596982.1 capsid protein [Listeria monocytogenes]EAE1602422.1 capsid protein [Listeria monocytogenes]